MIPFSSVAVLPVADDNTAIAFRTLAPGSVVDIGGTPVVFRHTVPEGHRFVARPIRTGMVLLSWSAPFARALHDLVPGDYVCTSSSLEILRSRGVQGLPDAPSVRNETLDPFRLDEDAFQVGRPVEPVANPRTFQGFARQRGPAGTRNHIALIGTSSGVGAFVTQLARRFSDDPAGAGFDGVVPVAHTEGGEAGEPNNIELTLSALAGFLHHPNLGAVLVVDEPGAAVNNERLRAFLHAGPGDPAIPHAFITRTGSFSDDLAAAADLVRGWIGPVSAARRTTCPLSDLTIALQCGGSDAFSGITANPLAGAVAREVIRHGGGAVLAETDELIGAEGYVLDNVRDIEVARRFLEKVEAFKERVAWHGQTAEENPSGGNVYRGIYNIVLKSLGAARKRDPAVRLEHVLGYGQPMPGPGLAFMDSPGNDLESVAGQVATGSTVVLFTTGNGSITNFPFVPTVKLVTTTARYELLSDEMDIDAGRFLTGTSMDRLTQEAFDLTVRVASGERTVGESAGHSQVSLWRDWKQTARRPGIATSPHSGTSTPLRLLPADERDAPLDGLPLPAPRATDAGPYGFRAVEVGGRPVPEAIALIMPTSLCSGQIALRLADRAEEETWLDGLVSRVVALPHTEGCGVTGGASEETYARTMVGYLTHPHVRLVLLLEHGCERTHNDYFRHRIVAAGHDPARFGWASIQADGGIDAVSARVRGWFTKAAAGLAPPAPVQGQLGDLSVGLDARGALDDTSAEVLAQVGSWIVGAGGMVTVPSRSALLDAERFLRRAFGHDVRPTATVAYGQVPARPGWHIMRAPNTDWLEVATGLGATGANLLLVHVTAGVTAHRFVPVVQVGAGHDDLDVTLTGDVETQAAQVLATLVETASGAYVPRAMAVGNIGFQLTRGLLGISM